LHDTATLYTWAGVCTGASSLCQPNAAAAETCAEQTSGAEGCEECTTGPCQLDPSHHGAVTTIWDWLNQLNQQGLAGYNDWRIPSIGSDGGTVEFETIVAPTTPPCSGAAFPPFDDNCTPGCSLTTCSCTSDAYWTAVTNIALPGHGSIAIFSDCGGVSGGAAKTNAYSARAVRSGR
jgi:hypothetical protein